MDERGGPMKNTVALHVDLDAAPESARLALIPPAHVHHALVRLFADVIQIS